MLKKTLTNTVDTNHNNIGTRFELLNNMITTLKELTVDINVPYRADNILKIAQSELNDVEQDYNDNSGEVLLQYYRHGNSSDYFTFLNGQSISARLIQCMTYTMECSELLKCVTEIGELSTKFNRTHVYDQDIQLFEFEVCKCGEKMIVSADRCEIVCYPCGITRTINGDTNDESTYSHQFSQNVKHGKYDPSRRCKFWIERIQGRESATIPVKCIEAVQNCINRDNIVDTKGVILCMQIRDYLKETKYTSYNDHVTLIRKTITGYCPPYLTDNELQIIYHIFNKVIIVFDEIKPVKKYNAMYYPYICGKIIYSVLPSGQRRRKILECIHMQSAITLISNDRLMKRICARVVEILYTPTIRAEYTVHQ
jgi:hypothetical protein